MILIIDKDGEATQKGALIDGEWDEVVKEGSAIFQSDLRGEFRMWNGSEWVPVPKRG